MQQLSAQDTLFLNLETPKTPMHVGGLYVFGPPAHGRGFNFEEFKAFMDQRLHTSRVFRQRLVQVPLDLSRPYWIEDPDFELERHLLHVSLPAPGGLPELLDLASQLYSKPLDLKCPLWELVVIEGLNNFPQLPDGAYAMLAKVHHAAIDGGSGAEIMAAIFDFSEEPRKVDPPKKEWKPEAVPTGAEVVVRSYLNTIGTPKKLFKFATETLGELAQVGAEVVSKALDPPPMLFTAPKTLFNVPVTANKVFGGTSVSLQRIKDIKNQVAGTTVNDVILSICGGAIRKYLDSKGKLPKKSLITMAPVSVRADQDKGGMGNKVSAMLVALGTDIADPVERLKAVHKSARSSKTYSRALKADKIMEFIPSELFSLASRMYIKMRMSEKHNPFYNTIITNVPGPPMPLFMNGSRMLAHYGMGVLYDGMGLMIVIFSYAGQVTICATSSKNIMPDMDYFGELMKETLDELEEYLVGKKLPNKGTATTNKKVTPRQKVTPTTKPKTTAKKKPVAKQEESAKKEVAKSTTRKPRSTATTRKQTKASTTTKKETPTKTTTRRRSTTTRKTTAKKTEEKPNLEVDKPSDEATDKS
ncbi:MAG: WS/DGAT/MGAT family O-acyltransferase [Flammeovirgaceae bacterium]